MPNMDEGLIHKYWVNRVDGQDKPNALYFVLDMANDPGAVEAVQTYILWCYENGYTLLAHDLEKTLEENDLTNW